MYIYKSNYDFIKLYMYRIEHSTQTIWNLILGYMYMYISLEMD